LIFLKKKLILSIKLIKENLMYRISLFNFLLFCGSSVLSYATPNPTDSQHNATQNSLDSIRTQIEKLISTNTSQNYAEAEKMLHNLMSSSHQDIQFWAIEKLAIMNRNGQTKLAQKDKNTGLKEAEKLFKLLMGQNTNPQFKTEAIMALASMYAQDETELGRVNKIEAYKEAERLLRIIINNDHSLMKNLALRWLAIYHRQGNTGLSHSNKQAALKEAEKIFNQFMTSPANNNEKFQAMLELALMHKNAQTELAQKNKIAGHKEAEKLLIMLVNQSSEAYKSFALNFLEQMKKEGLIENH
jgi:hypothetical protein